MLSLSEAFAMISKYRLEAKKRNLRNSEPETSVAS